MIIRKDEKPNISDNSRRLRIFDIAEFSVHDGPGIRTVIYFQGCNARCSWCHSPHSQFESAPILFNRNLCTDCRRCADVCPNEVHRFENGIHRLDRTACTQCGLCIDSCPNSIAGVKGSALHLPTVSLSVSDLFSQVEPYIRLTGKNGGITLSGGEALLQLEAAEEFLALCKQKGYHTAVETSGLLPLETYRRILPLVDLWLFGVRITTGDNENLHYQHINKVLDLLVEGKSDILPRIPLVPGFFDKEEVLNRLVGLLTARSVRTVCLNPWNRDFGLYYQQSGLSLQMNTPSTDEIDYCETKITSLFNQQNFKLYENRTAKANNDTACEKTL